MAERLENISGDEIAAVVTHLELDAMPDWTSLSLPEGLWIERITDVSTGRYLALFQSVGTEWLWQARLRLPPASLAAVLSDPNVTLHVLTDGRTDVGFAEIDFRAHPAELAYFGLKQEFTGQGLGRALMHQALAEIFERADRACVHTCTLDHPAALRFYQRCGFRPVRRQIEVMKDPRATGLLPKEAAPDIPYLGEH